MLIQMQHLNKDILCAIDIETTGLRAGYHDIVQIAVLPLDANIEPMKEIPPFTVYVKPLHPERAQHIAMKINGLSIPWLISNGLPPETVVGLFEDWYNKYITGNQFDKIQPLGSNYSGFDQQFLRELFDYDNEKGESFFTQYVSHRVRDITTLAIGFNDIAYYNVQTFPFPKLGLQNLAARFGITSNKAHDALEDCFLTAAVYRKMTQLRLNACGLDWGVDRNRENHDA